MTDEIGVKISDGDWKSLNNRLDAVDKSIKTTNTTVTDQGKQIEKQSVPIQNIVQIRMNQYSDYDTTSSVIPFDNTIPQSTEGKKMMEVTIKPQNEKNILIIEAIAMFSLSGGTYNGTMALFKNPGTDAICVSSATEYVGNLTISLSLKYKVMAGTTNDIHFYINMGCGNAAWPLYFNGSAAARKFGNIPKSYIQVTEFLEVATIDVAT